MLPHNRLAYSTCSSSPLQTAAQLEQRESPITLLSRDEKSSQNTRENWISMERWKEEDSLSLFFLLPCGSEQAFCSRSLTLGHCHCSSCYYCTHCCGLILPWATLSASQIVIAATPAMRQPAVEALQHL